MTVQNYPYTPDSPPSPAASPPQKKPKPADSRLEPTITPPTITAKLLSSPPLTSPSSTPPRASALPKAPSAPKKQLVYGGLEENRIPYNTNAIVIAGRIAAKKTPFSISIGQHTVTITNVVRLLGGGDYNKAYLVEGNGIPGQNPLETSQFVLKIPNEYYRMAANANMAETLRNELQQYFLAKEILSEHVANYYDLDLLLKQYPELTPDQITKEFVSTHLTHGCHLVKYIPHPYPVAKDVPDTLSKEDPNHQIDQQLKEMFLQAMHSGEPFDLKRDNVGVDEKQTVVLFDLMPMRDDPFLLLVVGKLKSFAPENSQRHAYLDPRG